MFNVTNPFCSFCDCEDCISGNSEYVNLYHAQTIDNRWICDICYAYDVCLDAGVNPCKIKECEHKPKLITGWTDVNGNGVK